MSDKSSLLNLADALFDCLMSDTDKDLIEEARSTGAYTETLSKQMRSQFREAMIEAKRKRT